MLVSTSATVHWLSDAYYINGRHWLELTLPVLLAGCYNNLICQSCEVHCIDTLKDIQSSHGSAHISMRTALYCDQPDVHTTFALTAQIVNH